MKSKNNQETLPASIGFRDDKIYEFLKGENVDLIDLKQIDRKECFEEMENYKKNQGIIY